MLVCKTWRERKKEKTVAWKRGKVISFGDDIILYTHEVQSCMYILRIDNGQVKWTYSLISL